jgi:hypothetical protein
MFLYRIADIDTRHIRAKNKLNRRLPNIADQASQTCRIKTDEIMIYMLKEKVNFDMPILNNHSTGLLNI